ncbi:MAG: thermonuclease family protein [Myxococcales bacterium]|nr:thermonuclease family protein [Myxococcales bacterium]
MIGLLVLLTACGSDEPAPCDNSHCGPCEAKVKRAVDGDTIELEDGTKVRYLLVDTPESTGGKKDCYGTEAKAFNADLVVGKTVQLNYDVQCRDMFGRLLAYVSVGGREVNSLLIERGYACVLHIPPNGTSRVDGYEQLKFAAKAAKKGLWGACETVTCEK